MLEIQQIHNKTAFAHRLIESLYKHHDSLCLDFFSRIKLTDRKSLKAFDQTPWARKILFPNRSFAFTKNEFYKNTDLLTKYLNRDWGFTISQNNHGLFARHTEFIAIADQSLRDAVLACLQDMVDEGVIAGFNFLADDE